MRFILKTFLSLAIITLLIGSISPTHARTELRCRRFLFFEFSCEEVGVDYTLTKQIRLSGQNDFTDKLDPVMDTQEMVFRIEIQNNGTATDDDLKIIDTLPQNLKFVSSDNMEGGLEEDRKVSAEIDGKLEVDETETFTYVAQANLEGITEGEKRCVTNNATLYRDENGDNEAQEQEIEASDSSTICILNGTPGENGFNDVNGNGGVNGEVTPTPTPAPVPVADELPSSAAGGLGVILSSLAALGSGAIISRKINF